MSLPRSHFFKEGKRGYVNFYAVHHRQRIASCRRVNFHRFVNVYLCGHLSFENLTDLFRRLETVVHAGEAAVRLVAGHIDEFALLFTGRAGLGGCGHHYSITAVCAFPGVFRKVRCFDIASFVPPAGFGSSWYSTMNIIISDPVATIIFGRQVHPGDAYLSADPDILAVPLNQKPIIWELKDGQKEKINKRLNRFDLAGCGKTAAPVRRLETFPNHNRRDYTVTLTTVPAFAR